MIRVWVRGVPTLVMPETDACLSSAESSRARGFRGSQQRERYVRIHTWLHARVAEVLDVPADRVPLHIDRHGAPVLRGCDHHLGLTHHHDRVALAVSDRGPVGVDILTVPTDADFVADTGLVLSDEEVALVTAADRDRRGSVFAACWTRKEAYAKLLRTGLTGGLARLTLTPAAGPAAGASFWTARLGDAVLSLATRDAEPLDVVVVG